LKQIPGFLLVREAGLELLILGTYGVFETFIRTKYPFCIKYSNISNWIFYPYPVKGSGKGKNKGNYRIAWLLSGKVYGTSVN
jgi:hypothetical protein